MIESKIVWVPKCLFTSDAWGAADKYTWLSIRWRSRAARYSSCHQVLYRWSMRCHKAIRKPSTAVATCENSRRGLKAIFYSARLPHYLRPAEANPLRVRAYYAGSVTKIRQGTSTLGTYVSKIANPKGLSRRRLPEKSHSHVTRLRYWG